MKRARSPDDIDPAAQGAADNTIITTPPQCGVVDVIDLESQCVSQIDFITRLPSDVVCIKILSLLCMHDLMRVAEVSKGWYDRSRHDSAWERHTSRTLRAFPELGQFFTKNTQPTRNRRVKRVKTKAKTKTWTTPNGHWRVFTKYLLPIAHGGGGTFRKVIGKWKSQETQLVLAITVLRSNLPYGLAYENIWEIKNEIPARHHTVYGYGNDITAHIKKGIHYIRDHRVILVATCTFDNEIYPCDFGQRTAPSLSPYNMPWFAYRSRRTWVRPLMRFLNETTWYLDEYVAPYHYGILIKGNMIVLLRDKIRKSKKKEGSFSKYGR